MTQTKVTTTDLVLDAAAEVFVRKGFKSATLDDVALAAGISKPTLYKYAESKQWLLDSISRSVRQNLASWADQPPQESGIVALQYYIRATCHSTTGTDIYYQATLNNILELSEEAAQESLAWRRIVTRRTEDALRKCQIEGSLNLPGDVAIYANLLQSILRGVFEWYDPQGAVSPDVLAQHIIDLLQSMSPPDQDDATRGMRSPTTADRR